MSNPSTCPPREQIRKYVSGQLDEAQSELVAEHLQDCPRCSVYVQGQYSTAEDHELRGDRLEVTATRQEDSDLTLAPTPFDPTLPDAEPDRELIELFPDRQGTSLGWIDDYEVQSELGRGGMGLVFKGFDRVLHRVVAIKVMSPRLASSERARRRFLREARAAAGVNHPNIVTIHAVGEYRGIPYLVMEYVAGRTLRQRIVGAPPLEPIDLIRISTQIADGLAQAHAQGVIHRDIKPANILLEDTVERVKIADFGLAHVALDVTELTTADQVIGTPSFMAPEQVRGEPVDQRTDLFCLGCVMYAMVAGRSPFMGRHTLDVIRRVCDEVPRPLDEVNPRVPRPLAQVVSKLLEKSPADRYQSAAEVAGVLRQLLVLENQELPPGARPAAPSAEPGELRRGRRRGSRRAWALGLTAAAVATLLGLWMIRPRPIKSVAPAGPDAIAPEVPPRTITVAATHEGDHRTIKAALDQATPGSTIRILDDATYNEAIVFANPSRMTGITLESPARATVRPPATAMSALLIQDTPGVTVRGLRLACATDQHVVLLNGKLEGVSLEKLDVAQPGSSLKAAVFLTEGTHGTPERPIRLSGLNLDAGTQGVVLAGMADGTPAASVRIEGCRVKGQMVLAILVEAVRDVTIADCIFTGGQIGLNLDLKQAGRSSGLTVRNNTFYNNTAWMGFEFTDLDHKDILIERNLIAGCSQIRPSVQGLESVAPVWFRDNLWLDAPDEELARLVATRVEAIRWVSTDEASSDYLRPADAAQVTIKDAGNGRSLHAGAQAPAASSSAPAN